MGPSLSEIECSLAGLDIQEVEKVLSVVQRDLEERQFVVNNTNLEKKDSMKEIVRLTNVPIVPKLYDEISDFNGSYDTDDDDHEDNHVVNQEGRYEKFDDMSLYDDDECLNHDSLSEKSDVGSEKIEAFLNEMSEEERSHIEDVRNPLDFITPL